MTILINRSPLERGNPTQEDRGVYKISKSNLLKRLNIKFYFP